MKSKKLSELTLEELDQKKKMAGGAVIGLLIVMVLAATILLYLIFKTKNFVLLAVLPACFMTILPVFIYVTQINKEIKSRHSK